MRLASVLVLTCVVEFIGTETIDSPEGKENETASTTEKNMVDHTYVALIDIVFTDNTKRTCTGTIIHENVVITAAHCFTKDNKRRIKPELTASFVVIGTKKMFETGYEQYLPIERVITHPRFKGWTADLCLVFTFAGMTSDKPGTLIPLAKEMISSHIDSNVTVLSWGHMKDIDSHKDWDKGDINDKIAKCSGSTSNEDCNKDNETPKYGEKKVTSNLEARLRHRSSYENTPFPFLKKPLQKERDRYDSKVKEKTKKVPAFLKSRSQNMKLISRYLSGEERKTTNPKHNHRDNNETTTNLYLMYDESTTRSNQNIFKRKHSESHSDPKYTYESYDNIWNRQMISETETDPDIYWQTDVTKPDSEDKVKSHYQNWRRQMGTQQNQLTVEIFGFVNVLACKKLVEKAMPAFYDISYNNDVVCYATKNHFITDEDSGAPAVRRGQLVAVTVGGAELDGDHVAVGMKMSCYCSWIADNLPSDGSHLQCCLDCCDLKQEEEFEGRSFQHINKYLI